MRIKQIITIITITAAAAIIIGCTPGGRKPIGASGDKTGTETVEAVEKSFNIKTTAAERQDISDRLTLSGDVEASTSVDVYPSTSGKLSLLTVETGNWVKKDQVLGKIDPSRPGMNYTESPIEAPISGTVTAINADPGATVSPQMPLITIGDISRLVISAQVSERFIYMIEKGQTAWVTTTASPGMKYKARISSVSPVVNPSSRTLKIELNLIEKSPIKAGMFVGIELITLTSKNSLVLPQKAVLSRDDTTFVYRITDNRSERVIVTTGIKNDGLVEIVTGLTENDIIVLEGATLLSNGSRVNILDNEGNR